MNEVSCRVFEIFRRPLESKRLALTDIVSGTAVPPARLGNKKERIDWPDFVAIMKNIRPHFTDAEYIAAGRTYMHMPGLRFAFVVAQLALSPIDLYRWMNKPRSGLGNQMFTCIVPTHREISANELVLELALQDGFEMCRDFFVIASAGVESLPQLFGLPPAHVVLTSLPRGARMHITIPTARIPLLTRVKRLATLPYTAWMAGHELKEAHETLSERFAQLEESRSKLNDFAARLQRAEQVSRLGILTSGLAHDLRNPANGIVNAVAPMKDLLPPELVGPESGVGQLLEVMSSCAEQIGFLSRQLLGFGKGTLHLDKKPVSVDELINRATRIAATALKDVEVRTKCEPNTSIQCAALLLVQVLTNLIENAGHAAGPQGWIEISTQRANGKVTIEISDSGPGVPIELRERIFEPFFTTKPPGVGTGLGLSISRAIVHHHGGLLEIREREGRAYFAIDLPARTESAADSPKATNGS